MPESSQETTLGEVIAEARRNARLNLRDLAAKIGIHFTYLADIEKNRVIPSENVILNISLQTELELEFDELMALAGRLGDKAENYLKHHPQFGRLLRAIANEEPSHDELTKLTNLNQTALKKFKNSK